MKLLEIVQAMPPPPQTGWPFLNQQHEMKAIPTTTSTATTTTTPTATETTEPNAAINVHAIKREEGGGGGQVMPLDTDFRQEYLLLHWRRSSRVLPLPYLPREAGDKQLKIQTVTVARLT